MNRPDLDALEREYVTPNDDAGEDVKELIAYARHLEASIHELATALEPIFEGHAPDYQRIARVLRKGEQP